MSKETPLLKQLLAIIEDIQATEITVLDVHQQTTVTDFMIICNGRSSRHVKSIAEQAMEKMKAAGYPSISHNGVNSGEWALVDFGDLVLHVMQPTTRAFYNLEELWETPSHDV